MRQRLDEQIIAQKIRHEELSFLSGAFAIYKIINDGICWKLLPDAFAILGGVLATVSFKKLYNTCSEDLEEIA